MTQKFWTHMDRPASYFVPFSEISGRSSGSIRDARCWALDQFTSKHVDIFAYRNSTGGGIGFEHEEDMCLFLLRWT